MKPFPLDRPTLQREFLEKKIQRLQINLAEQARILPDDLYSGLHTLQRIRMGFHEDLNQLFQAAAIASAYNALIETNKSYAKLEWEWNPMQGGTGNEPDLRGRKKDKIIVSAKIQTAHDAEGGAAQDIQQACRHLNKMEGRTWLFVANEKVADFAKAFIAREKLKLKVLELKISRVREEERGKLYRDV
jgi:hypothetical protein